MTDRAKVMLGLQLHALSTKCGDDGHYCPYFASDECSSLLCKDALELLKLEPRKEDQPKTVLHMAERSVIPVEALSGFCPKCNHVLMYGMNKHFCGNCGQAVKWNA